MMEYWNSEQSEAGDSFIKGGIKSPVRAIPLYSGMVERLYHRMFWRDFAQIKQKS